MVLKLLNRCSNGSVSSSGSTSGAGSIHSSRLHNGSRLSYRSNGGSSVCGSALVSSGFVVAGSSEQTQSEGEHAEFYEFHGCLFFVCFPLMPERKKGNPRLRIFFDFMCRATLRQLLYGAEWISPAISRFYPILAA